MDWGRRRYGGALDARGRPRWTSVGWPRGVLPRRRDELRVRFVRSPELSAEHRSAGEGDAAARVESREIPTEDDRCRRSVTKKATNDPSRYGPSRGSDRASIVIGSATAA